MVLRSLILALALAFALPATAEPICNPAKGTALTVVGVAANDTLNMRSGPAASYDLIARLKPAEKGVKATGRAAWAKGQCNTTCSGEEGGLNDTGRSIAYGCKARGQIWYEVTKSNGAKGWASARYLDLAGGDDGMVISPPVAPLPEVATQLTYRCGAAGKLVFSIRKGGKDARVTVGNKSYAVQRRDHLILRYSFAAANGARLRGDARLIEWRWPGGNKVTCSAG